MKKYIHNFLTNSRFGSVVLGVLILISLTAFTLETEFQGNKALDNIVFYITILFGIEYALRVWTASLSGKRGRWNYIFSFYGVVDLLAFLPGLLIASATGSVAFRLLRLLRLAQLLKIKPITQGLKRTGRALHSCRVELGISIIVSLALIFCGAVLMFFVEAKHQPEVFGSVPRALWWSIATLTTVGYGDVYPITALGKVLASFMALIGIGAVAMPAGIMAAAFQKTDT